jgi:hypothetical protein
MQSMQDCMFQKGYLLVPADQAEAVRERHAATAQLQPALPATLPPHAAAKPKPKPHPPQRSHQPQPPQIEQEQSQTPPWPSPEPPQQAPAWPSPK